MQCLAMAVIASFIGAKGLGWNLLLALNQLRIGLALEAGVCITLIAVLLDKLSLAGQINKKTILKIQQILRKISIFIYLVELLLLDIYFLL